MLHSGTALSGVSCSGGLFPGPWAPAPLAIGGLRPWPGSADRDFHVAQAEHSSALLHRSCVMATPFINIHQHRLASSLCCEPMRQVLVITSLKTVSSPDERDDSFPLSTQHFVPRLHCSQGSLSFQGAQVKAATDWLLCSSQAILEQDNQSLLPHPVDW